jgi:hypothetical protein
VKPTDIALLLLCAAIVGVAGYSLRGIQETGQIRAEQLKCARLIEDAQRRAGR